MRIKKKNKMSKRKLVFIIVFLGLLIGMGVYVYFNFFKSSPKIEEKQKVVDSITKYGYTVSDNDTKLFKEKFKELKEILNAKEVDNKKYAEKVAELFVIDFFTLDNKLTKNDIGGLQFIYNNYKSTFIDKSRDEFYKYVKNNLNGDRNQELPEVSTIKEGSTDSVTASDELKTEEFKNINEAYKVKLTWTYKKDLGYQTGATVVLVKDGDLKFSVAKMSESEE